MKRLTALWLKLKARHWDCELRSEEYPDSLFIWVERPPIRAWWDRNKGLAMRVLSWLVALIAGALILRIFGLG